LSFGFIYSHRYIHFTRQCLSVVICRFEVNGNIRVLVPEDAGLSVVKGAVVFGRQPEKIDSR